MNSTKFVVTHPLPRTALELLKAAGDVIGGQEIGPLSATRLKALVAGADGLVTMLSDRVDGQLVDAAGPQLRCVANVAVGYDNIAVDQLEARGVTVTNTPGVLTDATADIAIALLLMSTRRLAEAERTVRTGRPWRWAFDYMLGDSLAGKTLGIIGMGQIGRATAGRARAFGLNIVYHNRNRLPEADEQKFGARWLPIGQLLESSDFVSLHCPLTEATRHLIDAAALARMKPTAYLINTARGPVVDERALVTALVDGEIAGAGLDVYEDEPVVHPGLIDLDNVVLLPHLGSATVETREAMALLAARNVIEVCAGRPPITPVSHPGS